MRADRSEILDNAKYLRNVRPLDPAELREYVESRPHEGVVRQVLREHAVDLGVVEREDGTFVPASEEAITSHFDGVEKFPEKYEQTIEELLVERWGVDWHHGDSGDQLRETIRAFKEDYLQERDVEYGDGVALGYAIYHLPPYYAAMQYALGDLARGGLLSKNLRVLDVGAGVGGPALGLFDFLPEDALIEYHAVEPSDGADVLERLLETTPKNVHTEIHQETAEAFDAGSQNEDGGEEEKCGYDLVIFGNVLSELDDPTAVVEKYLDSLAPDGTLLALAPADENTSTQLRDVERTVEDDEATVYGPTPRLWPDARPTDYGWSFEERPDIEIPATQQRLAESASRPSEFINTDVKFSYSILRTDDARQYDVDLSGSRLLKLANTDNWVTERADAVVAKLSRNLADEESNPLFKVSDGSENTECYAVLVRETSLNKALSEAEYGDLLSIESALVLWNDDEGAYNLVVDEETFVDRV